MKSSSEKTNKEVDRILETLGHSMNQVETQRLGWRAQILMTRLGYESQISAEKQTRWLAIATTILALATIALATITFFR